MEKNSVKRNLFYNTIYQITVMLLPLVTAPYISRKIGATGLGIFSYNYSVALYFVYFAMLGISNYGNRYISKTEEKNRNKIFSSIYFFQLITSTIIFFCYILYSLFLVKNNQNISLIMLLYPAAAIFDVSWAFFGMQEFKITSIRQLIIKLITFISIFIFVKGKNDLWIYALIMSLGYFISAFSLWVMLWKKIKFQKTSLSEIKQHIKPCIVLFIPIIATSVYRIMDKIMIGKLSGMSQVGYYESAEKLIMVSLGLLGSFATVIMPKISNLLSKNENKKADDIFDKSMEFGLFIGIAISFGIAAISNEFIPIFFGKGFAPSINLSIALCISVPFITWSTITRNLYLIPHEKDKIYVQSVIYGAITNVILNLIFIPKYGAFGAVYGTIAAEIILAMYQTIKIHKNIKLRLYIKQLTVFLTFGFLMLLVVRIISNYLEQNVIGLLVEILVGACIYSTLSIVYFIKSKNEVFLNFFKKTKKKFENNKKVEIV